MRRVGTLGLVAALAVILVSPLPAHAEDASGAVTYNAGNGYSFEKLSHPTVGTSQPDGIVDYQGGVPLPFRAPTVTRPTTKAIAARATLGRL